MRAARFRQDAKNNHHLPGDYFSFQWRRELRDRFEEDFELVTGSRLRETYAVNVWNQHNQIITSMDLAKRDEILPSVRQADDWDLVIVDEAHRMSARDSEHKSERYRLGEFLRRRPPISAAHRHTAQRATRSTSALFLQLLDQEAYADVKSIHDAMDAGKPPVTCGAPKRSC